MPLIHLQSPPLLLYDPRFTTLGPTFAADTEVCLFSPFERSELESNACSGNQAWAVFLQAQQVIVSATQFVTDRDSAVKSKAGLSGIWERMIELDSLIEPLVTQADRWTLTTCSTVTLDESELIVAQALRGITRIKLNRSVFCRCTTCGSLTGPLIYH